MVISGVMGGRAQMLGAAAVGESAGCPDLGPDAKRRKRIRGDPLPPFQTGSAASLQPALKRDAGALGDSLCL